MKDPRSGTGPLNAAAEGLALLRRRGVLIEDPASAAPLVARLGAIRLSALRLPEEGPIAIEELLARHELEHGLRVAILDAAGVVELALRAGLGGSLAFAYGPRWHEAPGAFHHGFDLAGLKRHVAKALHRAEDPKGPAAEALPLGAWSMLFDQLRDKGLQREVAAPFGLHPKVLASWLHALSYLRNMAAHHERLWGRRLTITPRVVRAYRDALEPNQAPYAGFVMLQALVRPLEGHDRWAKRLQAEWQRRPPHETEWAYGLQRQWYRTKPWTSLAQGPEDPDADG